MPSLRSLWEAFKVFRNQSVMLVIIGYAFLWLTILSPHGTVSSPVSYRCV